MGVQGSGLSEDQFHKADDANEWIRILKNLEPEISREKAKEAFTTFEKIYSPEIIGHNAYISLQT